MKLNIQGRQFYTRKLTRKDAREILTWRYAGVQRVYDLANDEESFQDLLEPLNFGLSEKPRGQLLAFLTLGPQASVPLPELAGIYEDESYTDLALGLRPEECGKGLGKYIVAAGILLAAELFPEDGFRVTVARNNPAALSIYEALKFTKIAEFTGEILHPDKENNIIATETPMEILIAEPQLAGEIRSGKFKLN